MKIKGIKRTFFLFLIFTFIFNANVFSADTTNTSPAPYEEDEFPQGLKDLRRFEIIALGSMPFVTLDVNIAYSIGKPFVECMQTGNWSNYSFSNPLTASADYSSDEIKGVIWTAVGISVGIALTDYIINLVKRNKLQKAAYQNNKMNIYNITEDPDAIKLYNPFDIVPDEHTLPDLQDQQDSDEQNSDEKTLNETENATDSNSGEILQIETNQDGEN